MTDFAALLRCLATGGVEHIRVGGAAATAHGSARLTQDLDIVYRRSEDNIRRLVSALAPYKPYLRGALPGLPFAWHVGTIRRGLPDGIPISVFGTTCHCLGLERLIQVKRAAGRPRDLEAVAELEAILEERSGKGRFGQEGASGGS